MAVDGGKVYIHHWNSDGNWSIQTEQELFDPKPAQTAEMTQQL